MRQEPIKYQIEKLEIQKHEKPKKKKEEFNWDEVDSQITAITSEERAFTEPNREIVDVEKEDSEQSNERKCEENEKVESEHLENQQENKEHVNIEEPKVNDSSKEANERIVEENPEVEKKEQNNKEENVFDENDEEWITIENIDKKLHSNTLLKPEEENDKTKYMISIISSDFALQNIALKMGILINSIDGIRITRIKNYILKCYACNTFNFDTSRLFCEFCGYTTLMKIGYTVSDDGHVVIRDKEADPRLRGTQV